MDGSPTPPIDDPPNGNCTDDNANSSTSLINIQPVVSGISACTDHPAPPVVCISSKNVANVQPIITSAYQSAEEGNVERNQPSATDSLSLLGDTLPGFKTISIPSPIELPSKAAEGFIEDVENTEQSQEYHQQDRESNCSSNLVLSNVIEDNDSDSSDIDEDALSIIIAVEGEEEECIETDLKMEEEEPSAANCSIPDQLSEPMIDLTGSSTQSRTTFSSTASQRSESSTTKGGKHDSSDKSSSKQSAKVKQFFTTLQMFGNKISQEVAEQVQELIAALVVCAQNHLIQ